MKLTAEERRYITSERFIHDDLVKQSASLFEEARQLWRKKECPDQVILWPSEPVRGVDGEMIDGEILAPLPKDDRKAKLHRLVDMTKAYGLLTIELEPHALVARFESAHGTHSWRARVERHGDVDILGKTVESVDTDFYGLLWSPQQGTA